MYLYILYFICVIINYLIFFVGHGLFSLIVYLFVYQVSYLRIAWKHDAISDSLTIFHPDVLQNYYSILSFNPKTK